MEYIDYYKILGVSRNATQEEIRRAYRKRARKFHPDVNKEEGAEAEFKKVNEAHEVLRDPEKRKLYDAYGKDWQNGAQHRAAADWEQAFRRSNGGSAQTRTFRFGSDGSFGEAGGFSDFFNSLFGRGFAQQSHDFSDFSRAGRSHEADISVTLGEVINGGTKSISLQSHETDSSGLTRPAVKNLQVKIPKGVTDGSVIRLSGQGEKGFGGGASGDLLLRIHIAPDSRFKVNGHDLHTVIHVAPWEAVLGAKVDVQTVSGSVSLTIPKGSQNGRKLRLRGKGLPRKSGQPGDIIVELQVRVPTELSKEEEQLFKELSSRSKFDPRQRGGQRAGN